MRVFLLSVSMFLASCDSAPPKPTESEMDRVELALKDTPCVTDLNAWDRRYFYSRKINESMRAEYERGEKPSMWIFDHSIVEVDLRQAGFEEFGYGRKSYGDTEDPPGWMGIDDRSYNMATGTFDLTSGKLDLRSCGPNMSPP